jgi:hypothetical protein
MQNRINRPFQALRVDQEGLDICAATKWYSERPGAFFGCNARYSTKVMRQNLDSDRDDARRTFAAH